jgi:hypothetical protein
MSDTVTLQRAALNAINGALRPLNIELRRRVGGYDEGGLSSIHNHDFMRDPRFIAAYNRGVQAAQEDYGWHWRVHVGLWAANHGRQLEGDFVECGVNRGALSSAIMQYLSWNRLDKRFFLFDTFRGLDEKYVNEEEKARANAVAYVECFAEVQKNFEEFQNVYLIRGSVPETLPEAPIEKVCYLSIDMNCSEPEIAAASFFWDKLTPGAMMLLDDYGFKDFDTQKCAMDQFAASKGVEVLSVPTGQGIIIKP